MGSKASKTLATDSAESGGKGGPSRTIAFEDAELVKQAQNGEMQAFAALVAKYQDRVFNMVYRMTHRPEDAEELAQEAFLKALEKIREFRGQSQFYTWLFRIAANLVISHRRRSGRIKFHSLTGPEEFTESQAGALVRGTRSMRDADPPAAAISAERQHRVMQALEEIDDDMRLTVILRDMEDMDYAQIGSVLGVPVGTVKSRLHRARTILREKLQDLVK